jgi:hypothetical protein
MTSCTAVAVFAQDAGSVLFFVVVVVLQQIGLLLNIRHF